MIIRREKKAKLQAFPQAAALELKIFLLYRWTPYEAYPIPAGLYGLSQSYLFSEHGACFQNLDLQVATIQAEKSICLKQIVEFILAQRLDHNTILMPVIVHVPIHIDLSHIWNIFDLACEFPSQYLHGTA